jgi:hypothetical protein
MMVWLAMERWCEWISRPYRLDRLLAGWGYFWLDRVLVMDVIVVVVV